MNNIVSMQGMNRVDAIHQRSIARGRIHSGVGRRSPLHLVTPDEALRLSRVRPAYKRILRKHPILVDSAFVGLTLGASALMWWAGR